jgi:hypothetical protein
VADVKAVFDHVFSDLLGDQQKRLVGRIRDDWGKDEESAGYTNRLLDELEERSKKGGK